MTGPTPRQVLDTPMNPKTNDAEVTSLLVDDGRIIGVEPDQHLVGLFGDRWRCLRPSHEGEACSVELAAVTCTDLRSRMHNGTF